MNRAYCCDNLKMLREMDTQFDLILTDPPYNVGKDFGNDTDQQTADEYTEHLYLRIFHLPRILTDRGAVLWFCSQANIFPNLNLLQNKLNYQRMMIWHYRNGMSRQKKSPVTEFEPLLWLTKHPTEYTYNGDDVRVPYRSERVKNPVYKTNKNGEKKAWLPDPRGAKRGDVWDYPALAGALYQNERTEHPTQKPEALIMDLIKAFCPKNGDDLYEGKILDIYGGSGTTAVCCERLNKLGHHIQWVTVELEQKWVDVTNQRLAKVEHMLF